MSSVYIYVLCVYLCKCIYLCPLCLSMSSLYIYVLCVHLCPLCIFMFSVYIYELCVYLCSLCISMSSFYIYVHWAYLCPLCISMSSVYIYVNVYIYVISMFIAESLPLLKEQRVTQLRNTTLLKGKCHCKMCIQGY